MSRAVIFALAVSLAGSAAAQTTSCGWEMGRWVCREQPGLIAPPPAEPSHIYEDGMKAERRAYEQQRQVSDDIEVRRLGRQEAQRNQLQSAEDANRQQLHDMVGLAVAEGRCDDAKSLALKYGDMDLAEQSMRLCVQK